jgi:hypothetical protein
LIQLQFNFSSNADLGFNKKNKLVLSGMRADNVANSFDAMRTQLIQLPGVKGVTRSFDVPGRLRVLVYVLTVLILISLNCTASTLSGVAPLC